MRVGGGVAASVVMVLLAGDAWAQLAIPSGPAPQDQATLFRNQCGTCHSLDPADAPRQGPLLKGVYGRKPGSIAGFHYVGAYAAADWVWDEAHLDAYLTNPQAVFPGSIMSYRQANAETRKRLIAYLKEQQ